jgi:hypothetical protein
VPGPPAGDQQAHVPAAALPVWPPPTSPTPTGFQSRTGAAVLPAPPPPTIVPPPATNGTAVNGGANNGTVKQQDPVWPANSPATSAQYGEWARQQRPQGTVYGGVAPGQDRAPLGPGGTSSMEISGSLTGAILHGGRPVGVPLERSSGSRVVIISMIVICVVILIGMGAVVAHLAHVF